MTRRRLCRGQALVEFALVSPILILMTVGMVDFCRGFFAYEALAMAAREGARAAIVNAFPITGANSGSIVAAVRNSAVPVAVIDSTALSGNSTTLSNANITITGTPDLTAPTQVQVTVTFTFMPITGVIVKGFTLPIAASSTMQVP